MIGSINRRERIIARTWLIIVGAAFSLGVAAAVLFLWWCFAG
jgi:hypothetical protein